MISHPSRILFLIFQISFNINAKGLAVQFLEVPNPIIAIVTFAYAQLSLESFIPSTVLS